MMPESERETWDEEDWFPWDPDNQTSDDEWSFEESEDEEK